MTRRRARELVHGLSREVQLKDWDFALILAALKYYGRNRARSRAYCRQLSAQLRRQFGPLIKDTKRLHLSLATAPGNAKILELPLEKLDDLDR